jgi:hypothetical protein
MVGSTAYCWASGEITVVKGDRLLLGAQVICRSALGPKALRARVSVKARHAYDGRTLLVPGIPEAADEVAALLAMKRWRDWAFPGAPERLVS